MLVAKFLVQNWDSVLVIIIAVAGVIVLYKRGEIDVLKAILFRLVTRAEKEFGGGTGEMKKAAVIEWIYEKLPAILRIIITRKELEKMIDDVLEYAKGRWAENPSLCARTESENTTGTVINIAPIAPGAYIETKE